MAGQEECLFRVLCTLTRSVILLIIVIVILMDTVSGEICVLMYAGLYQITKELIVEVHNAILAKCLECADNRNHIYLAQIETSLLIVSTEVAS